MRNLKVVVLLGVLVAALIGGLYALNSLLFPGVGPDVGEPGPGGVRAPEGGARLEGAGPGGGRTSDGGVDPHPVDRPRGNPVLFTPGARPPRAGPDEIVHLARVQSLLDIALGDDQAAAQKAWTEIGDLVRTGVLSDPAGVAGALVLAMERGGNAAVWAAKILPWITDKTAREKISRDLVDLAIRSRDVHVLSAAFRAIGDIGDGAAVADLGRLSRTLTEWSAVAAALHAIGQIGTAESAEVLAQLLLDRAGTDVTPLVVKAMGSVESPEMAAALLPLTEAGHSMEVRLAAIDALGLTGRAEGVAALTALVAGEEDREIRTGAYAALGRIGTPEALDALIRGYKGGGELALTAGFAVGNSTRPESVGRIIAFFDEIDDPQVKVRCVEALGNIRSEDALPKLREVLSSDAENPDVRGRSAVSLAKLGNVEAVPAITAVLAGASAEDSNMVIHLTDAVKQMARYPDARKDLIEKTLPVLERLTAGEGRGHVYYYALLARQTIEALRQR